MDNSSSGNSSGTGKMDKNLLKSLWETGFSGKAGFFTRALAIFFLIQAYSLIYGVWAGLDGNCETRPIQGAWDAPGNTGCMVGLGIRGFLEGTPRPPSLSNKEP